jgi:hypothetical protein
MQARLVREGYARTLAPRPPERILAQQLEGCIRRRRQLVMISYFRH